MNFADFVESGGHNPTFSASYSERRSDCIDRDCYL
jgi:hypothetical protein